MKSYNNLFEKFISDDNIELAIKNAFQGSKKKNRKDVKKALADPETLKKRVREYALNFKNCEHTPKEIYDGISRKKRTIIVPKMMEQIVHHMVCNVLIPIIQPSLYEHSYASLPNKGANLGKKYIEKHIRRGKDVKYYFKFDIQKYFNTIPHDVLKAKFSRIIRDKRFLGVIFEIIDVIPVGIPFGFYTFHWLANFYLSEFDHWVKEELKSAAYYRYMDDRVIFSDNKRTLHRMKNQIEQYINNDIGLKLKDNWQVVRFDYTKKDGSVIGRDLDFMGFRFYRNRTTMRKKILHKARTKANRISKKKRYTIHDCRQMLSYNGYFKHTDTYNYKMRWITTKVNMRAMKKRISDFDRRKNNEQMERSRVCERISTAC